MRFTRIQLVSSVAALVLVLSLFAVSHADDAALAKLFKNRGITGTIVISSLDGKTEYVSDSARAATRFIPASTFKIPNTLIALDVGAIADEKTVIPWDGRDKGLKEWNRDQSLLTAFPVSCVWFYQELAKRVGPEKYVAHMKKTGYGNGRADPDVTTFWLAGNLMISPMEQVAFLRKLYNGSLPYKKAHIEIVKRLMINEEKPAYTLRAKTGWTARVTPQQGWFVGYVETKGQVWLFATNIEVRSDADLALRKGITMEALKAKGII